MTASDQVRVELQQQLFKGLLRLPANWLNGLAMSSKDRLPVRTVHTSSAKQPPIALTQHCSSAALNYMCTCPASPSMHLNAG